MNLETIDSIKIILLFITPGLISTYIRSQFTIGRPSNQTETAFSYITLSVIYLAIILPFFYKFNFDQPYALLAWVFIIFIGPAIFGFILGFLAQKGSIRSILKFFRLNTIHPVPSAWDWKFGKSSEQWILVVLKDDTKFAGFYGAQSFASSDPAERDLYIQKVYNIDDDNVWYPRNNGVLIAASEIKSIEFWPYEVAGEQDVKG